MESGWDSPQVFVTDDGDGFIQVGLHAEEAASSYSSVSMHKCDYTFSLSAQRVNGYKSDLLLKDDHYVYELFGGKVNDKILGKRIIKAYSRFDKLVLNLYYGGSLLVWDESPEDIGYCNDY